jgi:DNA-binding transcriptional MocR family regulator
MAKYRQLAEKFISDITSGKLKTGDRMLSLRQLAKQHNVSLSTAVNCYSELEALGWLIARPQAGYFIAPKRQSASTPEWQHFNSHVSSVSVIRPKPTIKSGPLGTSCLAIDDKTKAMLSSSFRRATKQALDCITDYPLRQGEPRLLNALASHFSELGFALHADELVITHGCLDAVKTALEVCTHPGDTIAVSSPCFSGLLDVLAQLSLQLVEIPSIENGIDLEQFEQHLKSGAVQAGLFCTTHMNPQGITMSVAQKQELAQLANHYRIPIIEDDIYLELSHSNQQPLPASYYDEGGYMLWCSSISKTLAPSYRLGWCRPGRYYQAYLKRALGVTTLIQLAMADFFDTGAYAKHLKRARYQLQLNKQRYLAYLDEHLPRGSRITQPDGGLVLWIQIPNVDTNQLSIVAQKEDLDIRTGNLFTTSERYQDCLRINIGFPFDPTIQQQLDRLMSLINSTIILRP